MALLLVQYTSVTIEAPTPTDGGLSSIQSASDLEGHLGDLVIPQEEKQNATTTQIRKNRGVPDNAALLNDIGDFRLPSDVTVGHVAKVAK